MPTDLERVWQDMQKLKQHPRFWDGVEALDARLRESQVRILHVHRIWLADGRKEQVQQAMMAVRSAIEGLTCDRGAADS